MFLLADWLAVCMLGPAWFYAGKLAQKLRLPLISGYLVAGALSGPYGLNLLHDDVVKHLVILDHVCLGLIALAAGAEVQLSELQKTLKQVATVTLGISIVTWLFVFTTMLALGPYLAFTDHLQPRQVEGIASLAATLAIARSPASAIAVLKETEGKGPYCSLVMSVVVVKDVLVFSLFAVNIELASVLTRKGASDLTIGALLEPFLSLFIATCVGVAGAACLGLLQQLKTMPTAVRLTSGLSRRMPAHAVQKVKNAAILVVAAATFLVADKLHAEPLLACVTVGLITANRGGDSFGRDMQDELSNGLHQLMPLVNIAFFGLSGASLKLAGLAQGLWVAGAVYAVRLAAIYCGSWAGCWVGRVAADHRKRVWCGMITQAGVALGLAKQVAMRFPEWGPDFATLMITIIIINLMTGPLLFKSAVIAAGEARALTSTGFGGEFEADSEPKRERYHGDDVEQALTRGASRAPVKTSTSAADSRATN